jgi:hypothetical protein
MRSVYAETGPRRERPAPGGETVQNKRHGMRSCTSATLARRAFSLSQFQPPRTVRSAHLQTGAPGKHPHRMPANAFLFQEIDDVKSDVCKEFKNMILDTLQFYVLFIVNYML